MKQIEDKCFKLNSSSSLPDWINDKVKIIYLVPAFEMGFHYGVILYERTGFEGHAAMAYSTGREDKAIAWPLSSAINPSSAIPFILNFNPSPTSYIELYQLINWNRADKNAQKQRIEAGYFINQPALQIPIELPAPPKAKASWPEIGSLKIEPPNKYIVVFFPDNRPDWTDATPIDIYITEDSDLNGNIMGGAGGVLMPWNPECEKESLINTETSESGWITYPCAGAMVIVSASTF
jgi:hypothetical protein